MSDFWVALGLVLVIEGITYALFPDAMKRMAVMVQMLPPAILRRTGLIAAVIGVAVIWLIRRPI